MSNFGIGNFGTSGHTPISYGTGPTMIHHPGLIAIIVVAVLVLAFRKKRSTQASWEAEGGISEKERRRRQTLKAGAHTSFNAFQNHHRPHHHHHHR